MRYASAALLVMAASSAWPQDFGPVSTRNHRAISLQFLRFDSSGGPLNPGGKALSIAGSVSNSFRRIPDFGLAAVEEDYEVHRLAIRYRERLNSGIEWAIEASVLSRSGGFLDSIIQSWHEYVLRWSSPTRDFFPFGRSVVSVPGAGPFGSATGIGDVAAFISIPAGRRTTAIIGFKAPTGDPDRLLGSGGFDYGLAVRHHVSLGRRWMLHAMAGAIRQGGGSALHGERAWVHQESVAFAWRQSHRDNWVLQWDGEASAIATGVAASDATHRLLTLGYQRGLSERTLFELSLSEDRDLYVRLPELVNLGADFTVAARIEFRF